MKISVIIPAFNEDIFIGRTLRKIKSACLSFSELGWESEIVVCDNNSSDETARKSISAGARVVFEPINQISRARNTGASAASGDWFVFIDADAYPSKELFADIARAVQTGKVIGGGVTVCMKSTPVLASIWNALSRICRWGIGSAIFCDASAFRNLEGFSTEWYAAEEIDFCKRLKRLAKLQGKRFVILSKNPIVASARKASKYSIWEYLSIWLKAGVTGGRNLKDRNQCGFWYAERTG